MILLMLGTHEQPFERAVDWVLPFAEREEVVVQLGHTPARNDVAAVRWIDFAPYEQIVDLCRAARAVVCHAGVGTIMTARAAGKTPVVIPRLAKYGEHVDDHQLEIAREFAQRGLVVTLDEGGDLDAALSRTAELRPLPNQGEALRRAVAEAVG